MIKFFKKMWCEHKADNLARKILNDEIERMRENQKQKSTYKITSAEEKRKGKNMITYEDLGDLYNKPR